MTHQFELELGSDYCFQMIEDQFGDNTDVHIMACRIELFYVDYIIPLSLLRATEYHAALSLLR